MAIKEVYYRAVNYDLNTIKLEKDFGSKYRSKYNELNIFFKKHDFHHRQGSGWISNEKMTRLQFWNIIDQLKHEKEWVTKYIRDIVLTNIVGEHDIKIHWNKKQINKNIELENIFKTK